MQWIVRIYYYAYYFLLEDRAYDFMKADGVERIIFAYKYYHPRFRPSTVSFINQVFFHGVKFLDVQKLINYT
jgi:hypothetical protein